MELLKVLIIFLTQFQLSLSKAIDLGDQSFREIENSDQVYLLLMYAPWCGHCKTVKPVLENFVHPEATIAMIDCTKNEQTCDRFKVKSYPTIVRFVKGTYWPHKGKRTAEDFWNFLNGNYKKEKEQTVETIRQYDEVLRKIDYFKKQVQKKVQKFGIKNVIIVGLFIFALFVILLLECFCSKKKTEQQTKKAQKKRD